MIMMPSKAALSRIFSNSSHLLSRAWNKITFSSAENRPSQTRPEHSSLSVSSLRVDTNPQPPDLDGMKSNLPVSIEALAEQMLSIVEIVSVQEKTIQALKQRCQKLEDHDQAIMVAFTTFFHVLAAGRVARIDEITHILNNITSIAEREERPRDAIAFLRELVALLSEQPSDAAASADADAQKESH